MKAEGRNFRSLKGAHWVSPEAGKGPVVAGVLLVSSLVCLLSAIAATMIAGSMTMVMVVWLAVIAFSMAVLAYLQLFPRKRRAHKTLPDRTSWIQQPVAEADVTRLLQRTESEREKQALQRKTALILGRDSGSTKRLQGWLEEIHDEAMICHDPQEAMDWIEHHPAFFDYVLIDLGGIGSQACETFLAQLVASDPGMKSILLVPFPYWENRVPPPGAGTSNAIRVPIGKAALHASISSALRDHQEALGA